MADDPRDSPVVGAPVRGVGTQDRRWVQAEVLPVAEERYDVAQRTERIPMRDGITLAAVVLEPALPPGTPPPPCVVVTNGYAGNDDTLLPNLRQLAARGGYPVVMARLRGVGESAGKAGLYEKYGEDGHDVVEWAARQSFTNGRVGTVGASLLGISQWLAAKQRPEHLVAMVPDDSPNNTYDYLWYQAGMPPGPGRKRRNEVPGVESEYAVAAGHPWFDDFWRERSATREDIQALARAGVPALMSSGWDSYMIDAAPRAFRWMREAGAGSRAKLVIGPWRHAGMFSAGASTYDPVPSETIRPRTGSEIQRLWLDRWLRDERNGIDDEPPVLIFVQGPDQWRFESDWPLPDEKRVRLFLSARAAGAATSLNDGSLAPTVSADPARTAYTFDPEVSRNPAAVSMPTVVYPSDGGPPAEVPATLPPGASRPHGRLVLDKSAYEADALTWTSDVLDRPSEITGYPSLVVWASVSTADALLVAELTDVAPDGAGGWTSTQVTRGFLRAGAQFSRTGPVELHPDDVYRFDVELHPTSYVVAAGHRVRLTLQGAPIDPTIDVSYQGPGPADRPFQVTVHTGPTWVSHLDVPFVGSEPF